MELSKRLQGSCSVVSSGVTVADVGTDHGYIPISFVESGKNKCAIAMDINRGPLDRPQKHIFGRRNWGHRLRLDCQTGVKKLQIGECVLCVIVSGMGGGGSVHKIQWKMEKRFSEI